MVSSSNAHFPLQMTAVALEHTHIYMQLETHQEQKFKLQVIQFVCCQSSHSCKVRIPVIPAQEKLPIQLEYSKRIFK